MIESMHHGANNRVNPEVSFTPMAKPLSESSVALVSTAGVHLVDQAPFDVSSTAGDPTFRVIGDDADVSQLRFTHTHYDTAPANEDPNVVFPLQRLHEYVDEGRLGSTASFHIGMMGFNPDPTNIADHTAPEVAGLLAEAGVDVVLLVPG
jgi:D-proline reductase (dithiol) PrdB